MKAALVCLLGALLVAGSTAQEAEACDPATAGTALIDLTTNIGELACKVPPSVNLTDVMGKLTGTLSTITAEQLEKLPGLIEATITANPAALEPFFALSAAELETVVPLLTQVGADQLQVVFPLIAKQPAGTMEKMLNYLSGVSLEQLKRISPLFSRINQGEINIMLHALNVLPSHAWDLLIKIVQGMGPVNDVVVGAHQSVGLLPKNPGNTPQDSDAVVQFKPIVTVGGRKMLQETDAETDAAAAALAAAAAAAQPAADATAAPDAAAPAAEGACDPSVAVSVRQFSSDDNGLTYMDQMTPHERLIGWNQGQQQGIEVGVSLLGDFGSVVCKFGADTLKPALVNMLDVLNRQSEETLANMPAFTDQLTRLDPAAFSAFFKIPSDTLKALIPVVQGMDPAAVTAQMKLLGTQSPETIEKMVYLLDNTLLDRVELLIPLFAQLTNEQVLTFVKLTNSLSAGQIILTIHLLDQFGFAVDVIGQKVPTARAGSTLSIGPIKVTFAQNAAASSSSSSSSSRGTLAAFFRHPFQVLFGGR